MVGHIRERQKKSSLINVIHKFSFIIHSISWNYLFLIVLVLWLDSHFEQLNKLHELYNGRTGRSEQRPVSRCQSLMFSELITEVPKDFDTNSIASEPAYLPVRKKNFYGSMVLIKMYGLY
jgi:hypothetical protein